MKIKTINSDKDFLDFSRKSGFVTMSDRFIEENNETELIIEIKKNYFFNQLNETLQKRIIERLLQLQSQTSVLLEELENRYCNNVISISVAGSFTYKAKPCDLDLNVILNGRGIFDYYEKNNLNLGFNIEKTSFMVFSKEDLLSSQGELQTKDNIYSEDFIHEDLIAREMLIAPLRNITIYGHTIEQKDVSKRDILVRLGRQLYFASKTLNGEIRKYENAEKRTNKAISRLVEAEMILKWLVGQMDDAKSAASINVL
jgi:hypothetical protein